MRPLKAYYGVEEGWIVDSRRSTTDINVEQFLFVFPDGRLMWLPEWAVRVNIMTLQKDSEAK
jgi:hypothetical protein